MNKPLIISRPELQSPQQKYFFSLLTLAFWLIWFYLWLPLVSLVAWMMGFEFFYEHMIRLNGVFGLLDVIGWYGLVVAISALGLLLWSAYNLSRFQGRDKRKHSAVVTVAQLAESFCIEETAARLCQEEKRVTIDIDRNGIIHSINDRPQINTCQAQVDAQSVARNGAG
jgi:biofilm PGA synthesis protein PgaD